MIAIRQTWTAFVGRPKGVRYDAAGRSENSRDNNVLAFRVLSFIVNVVVCIYSLSQVHIVTALLVSYSKIMLRVAPATRSFAV